MYYTGIDLHKKASFITTVDEQGHVQARRNLPNQLPVILEYFSVLAQPTKVVIESMGSWYWLYDALREADHEVIISNPCQTKAIASAKIKNDKIDSHMLAQLAGFDATDSSGSGPPTSVDDALQRMSGVDLTGIDGIDTTSVLKIIAGVETDMSRWKSAKHFASWLGLCPGTKITGGKLISAKRKSVANRGATTLRMAAFTLLRSKSALGAYLRWQRSRLGAPKAITVTANKMARLVYSMLKHGSAYVDLGQNYYEERYRNRTIKSLKRKAQTFGYLLVKEAETQSLPLST
jgi:transposase